MTPKKKKEVTKPEPALEQMSDPGPDETETIAPTPSNEMKKVELVDNDQKGDENPIVTVVGVINKSKHKQLEQKTVGSSGFDICANLPYPVQLKQGKIDVVTTGVYMELPEGYEAQVRPRSGLATKGVTVVNSPGTIDEDYRGEVKVILTNFSSTPVLIKNGDRIAQIVFVKKDKIQLEFVNELSKTERGEGGFGHTGTK